MGFTAAEDAKPKVPHASGLKCRCCEAEFASQWRGPDLAFCSLSKCRKAAAAASTKTAPWKAKLKELDDDMDDMLRRLEKLEATVDRRSQRHAEQLEAHAAQLAEQDEVISSLRAQLAQLAHVVHSKPATAGAKRPALNELDARFAQVAR